jgi:hypothetical protein
LCSPLFFPTESQLLSFFLSFFLAHSCVDGPRGHMYMNLYHAAGQPGLCFSSLWLLVINIIKISQDTLWRYHVSQMRNDAMEAIFFKNGRLDDSDPSCWIKTLYGNILLDSGLLEKHGRTRNIVRNDWAKT